MKQTIYTVLCFIGILSAASCSRHQDVNALLVHADSVMEAHPDSALNMLQNIGYKALSTQEEHAYYALLLTQARDKNYIVQTDDSLIRTAVHYYDSIGDISMQAKAHYYKGSVHRDANRCGEAIHEYLTAIQFAEKTDNKKLLGLSYNQAGYLYYLQDLLEEADSIYQQAEKMAIQLNDTSLWTEALTFQGKICMERGGKYSKAEENLLKAFELINTTSHKMLQADIAASLSKLYNAMNQSTKAILFAKQNIALRDDTLCYRAYSILGNAYLKAEKYDSATLYINKSLLSPMYDIKANAYKQLATIANIKGNVHKSFELTNKHMLYADSARRSQQGYDILSAEKEMESQQYAKLLRSRYPKNAVLIIGFILTLSAIGFICFLHNRYKKNTQDLEKRKYCIEQEKQKLQQKYAQLKESIIAKDSEIASLKESLNKQQISKEAKEKILQELNISYKDRNALIKEVFEHSDVYAKMERIIESFKLCERSDEKMNDEDWKQLIAEMNYRWNGAITRLDSRCQLSKKELHLCCLYLTDIPLSSFEYLIEYKRSSIYRKEKDILIKMGYSADSGKLKDILKKV